MLKNLSSINNVYVMLLSNEKQRQVFSTSQCSFSFVSFHASSLNQSSPRKHNITPSLKVNFNFMISNLIKLHLWKLLLRLRLPLLILLHNCLHFILLWLYLGHFWFLVKQKIVSSTPDALWDGSINLWL